MKDIQKDKKPEKTSKEHKILPEVKTIETVPVPEPIQQISIPVNQVVTTKTTNGFAIASLIVGIVAFMIGWVPFIGLLAGIVAVVFGVIAIKQKRGDNGLSLAGIITGGFAFMTGLLVLMLMIIGLFTGNFIQGEWLVKGTDQTFVFKNNGEYILYMDGSDRQDNYIYGKYTIQENVDRSAGGYDLFDLTLENNGTRKDYGFGNRKENKQLNLLVGVDHKNKDSIIIEDPISEDVTQLDKIIK